MPIKIEVEVKTPRPLSSLAGTIREKAKRYLDQRKGILLQRITRIWPVDTGRSIAAWNVANVGELSFKIENPVYYSLFVHRKGARGKPARKTGWKTIWNAEIAGKSWAPTPHGPNPSAIIPVWTSETVAGIRAIIGEAVQSQVRGGRIRLR